MRPLEAASAQSTGGSQSEMILKLASVQKRAKSEEREHSYGLVLRLSLDRPEFENNLATRLKKFITCTVVYILRPKDFRRTHYGKPRTYD